MSTYQIIVADVLDGLRGLSAGSVHCAATSPPFFGLRDYGLPPSEWPAVEYAPMAGLPPVTVPAMACCLGLEPDPLAYIGHLVLIWREVWRVLRDDGVCWANWGDSFNSNSSGGLSGSSLTKGGTQPAHNRAASKVHPVALKPKDLLMIPSRAALALQADGWYLRSAIVWAKGISFCPTYSGSVMPESVTDRPTSAHEMIYLLAKRPAYFYDAEAVKESGSIAAGTCAAKGATGRLQKGVNGRPPEYWEYSGTRNLRNVWAISPRGNPIAHFATWPEDLVRPMVLAGSPAKCCAKCGAPWERVVEREGQLEGRERNRGGRTDGYALPAQWKNGVNPTTTVTTGFRPTCACIRERIPRHDLPIEEALALADAVCREFGGVGRSTVLDIFAGSGTTLRVALQEGRHAIGVEANPEYAEMARRGCENYHKPIPRPARVNEEQPALFEVA